MVNRDFCHSHFMASQTTRTLNQRIGLIVTLLNQGYTIQWMLLHYYKIPVIRKCLFKFLWLALDDPSHLLGSSATDCARCHHLSTLPVLGYLCPYGVCHYIIFAHGLGIFPSQSLFLLFSNFNFDVVLRTTGLDLSALQRMYPRRNIENSNCLPKSNLNQLFHSFNSLDTLLRSSALTLKDLLPLFLAFDHQLAGFLSPNRPSSWTKGASEDVDSTVQWLILNPLCLTCQNNKNLSFKYKNRYFLLSKLRIFYNSTLSKKAFVRTQDLSLA